MRNYLKTSLGYETYLLEDPCAEQVLEAVESARAKMNCALRECRLLIYYSGPATRHQVGVSPHGENLFGLRIHLSEAETLDLRQIIDDIDKAERPLPE
jgi:hypothetical protein